MTLHASLGKLINLGDPNNRYTYGGVVFKAALDASGQIHFVPETTNTDPNSWELTEGRRENKMVWANPGRSMFYREKYYPGFTTKISLKEALDMGLKIQH